MRRFIVEAVVDAIVVAMVFVLFSLVKVSQPFPFGNEQAPIFVAGQGSLPRLLIAAAILVLSQRYVRPLVVAFTGRLLLSTMGLFVVVVNMIVIWVASLVAPDIGTIATPTILWLLVFAVLYTVLSSLADALLGLNRPKVDVTASSDALWRFLESLPTPRRNLIIENLRLQQIYDLVYQTGLDMTLARTPIGSFRKWFATRVLREPDLVSDLTGPERLRMLLQRLGPTYVKIGQMIASRGDALPKELVDELSKLQSEAAPFPWEDAREVVKAELHRYPEELFATIEAEPFAAASTAQVHRATLPDGTPVAVKIQRPRIVAKTKADLGVITELATIAERRLALARKVGVRSMVDEFAGGVLDELDYTNEAYQAKRLDDNMAKFPDIAVPRIHDAFSGKRVLTMELIRGIKITKVDELREAGFDTERLGNSFIRAVIKQVLIDGFFHGDPHPGNLMADPHGKRLVFLDLGLVGQLSSTQRVDLLGLIYAIQAVDIQGIADGLISLGRPTPGFEEARFRADVDRLARQYLVYGGVSSIGEALTSFMGAVFEDGLRLESSLTLAIKAVIQAEQTASALAPSVSMAQQAMEEARAALLASLEPDRVFKSLSTTAVRVSKEVARRTPSLEAAAFKWIDLFNKGKIVVEVDTSDLTKAIDGVSVLGQNATVGLIVVGQLIGTAIAMIILLQPALVEFAGFAYIAMIAFALTLVVSFVVLFRMLFRAPGRRD